MKKSADEKKMSEKQRRKSVDSVGSSGSASRIPKPGQTKSNGATTAKVKVKSSSKKKTVQDDEDGPPPPMPDLPDIPMSQDGLEADVPPPPIPDIPSLSEQPKSPTKAKKKKSSKKKKNGVTEVPSIPPPPPPVPFEQDYGDPPTMPEDLQVPDIPTDLPDIPAIPSPPSLPLQQRQHKQQEEETIELPFTTKDEENETLSAPEVPDLPTQIETNQTPEVPDLPIQLETSQTPEVPDFPSPPEIPDFGEENEDVSAPEIPDLPPMESEQLVQNIEQNDDNNDDEEEEEYNKNLVGAKEREPSTSQELSPLPSPPIVEEESSGSRQGKSNRGDPETSMPDTPEVKPYAYEEIGLPTLEGSASSKQRPSNPRSLSLRRGQKNPPRLSADLVTLDGVDPVPNMDSPAQRQGLYHSLPFSDDDEDKEEENPVGDTDQQKVVEEDNATNSPSASSSSSSGYEFPEQSMQSPNSMGSDSSNQLEPVKSAIIKLLEVAASKNLSQMRKTKAFHMLREHSLKLFGNNEQQEEEEGQAREEVHYASNQRISYSASSSRGTTLSMTPRTQPDRQDEEHEQHVDYSEYSRTEDTPRSRKLSGVPVDVSKELLRLRDKVKQQDQQLRHVKRLLVIHSIFFKWKVWYLTRLHERVEADMEQERFDMADRILQLSSRLEQ